MMKYKLYLVPFPFDDLSSAKVRPTICLTEPIGPHRHIVLAFITSRVPGEPLVTDLILATDIPNFHATGLRVSSTIQLHRLMTANSEFIQRELGELPSALRDEVDQRLRELFVLPQTTGKNAQVSDSPEELET
jgi:mRNA interferase MazF